MTVIVIIHKFCLRGIFCGSFKLDCAVSFFKAVMNNHEFLNQVTDYPVSWS
jgi:hypothetical protein